MENTTQEEILEETEQEGLVEARWGASQHDYCPAGRRRLPLVASGEGQGDGQ